MIKKILFLTMLLSFSLSTKADFNSYECEIKQVIEVNDNGLMDKHVGIYKGYIGKKFSIDRVSGAMIGDAFATTYDKTITVIDKGSKDNAYKAIVTSNPPNIWVKFIVVNEFHNTKIKSFWGTADTNTILSGQCK
jgi:hypothetical protein